MPFVRTYITVVAGVTRMDAQGLPQWSAIGAVLWVFTITLLGYFLGTTVPWLGDNIDYVTARDPGVHRGAVRHRVVPAPPAQARGSGHEGHHRPRAAPAVDATDKP